MFYVLSTRQQGSNWGQNKSSRKIQQHSNQFYPGFLMKILLTADQFSFMVQFTELKGKGNPLRGIAVIIFTLGALAALILSKHTEVGHIQSDIDRLLQHGNYPRQVARLIVCHNA